MYFRASRKTFDTTETQKEIGPIVVQFGKVSKKKKKKKKFCFSLCFLIFLIFFLCLFFLF